MGYTTDFSGGFILDEALTVSQIETLKTFNRERHDDPGFPGVWCQWVATSDGTGIEWDGDEKFYNYTEWLEYLIKIYLKPWGRTLSGRVAWAGEDNGDTGTIFVKDNRVKEVVTPATPEPDWDEEDEDDDEA